MNRTLFWLMAAGCLISGMITIFMIVTGDWLIAIASAIIGLVLAVPVDRYIMGRDR